MFVLGQVNLLTGSIFLPSHMSPSSSNRGVGCTASWHLRFWNMKHERWWNMHPWELDDLNVSKCRHHPGYPGFILAFGLRALPNWYQSSASLSVQICACRAITMKASTAASKASWWRPACTRALELGTWTHGFCAAWHDNKCSLQWTQRSDSYGPDSKHQTSHNFIAVHWWDMMRSLMFFFFSKKKHWCTLHAFSLSSYLRSQTSDRSFREAWPSAHKLCHTKGSLCRCCVPGVSRWVQMSTVDVPYGSIWDILQRSSKTHMLSNVQVCVAVLSPAHTVNALRPNGKWHLHIWSESVTASWNDRRLLPKLVWQM